MPRVLARFTVSGSASGFPTNATRMTIGFALLDDGSCVAAVVEPSQCFIENANAYIDPVETTLQTTVYMCRFTLVYCDGTAAARGEVIGWLSKKKGLESQYVLHGDPGSVVQSYPLNLPLLDAQPAAHESVEALPEPASPAQHVPVNDPVARNTQRPMQMVFRGRQVDANGKTYATTLFLTKVAGETHIEGFAREASRKSRVVGLWDGDRVQFRLAYPLKKGVVYNYDYDGNAVTSTGTTRLAGTWRFAGADGSEPPHGAVLTGKFDFVRDDSPTSWRRTAP